MKIHLKGIFDTKQVWLNGEELSIKESSKASNHSAEFNWGYYGSGPAQLALAICLIIMPKDRAFKRHQDFKHKYIAKLPEKDFDIILDLTAEDGI